MDQEDPFLTVHRDVLTLLSQTRPLLNSYLRIRATATSPKNPELLESRVELESALSDISNDVADLVESVKAVEGDPYRYGLDVAEVGRRRGLVDDVQKEVEDMRRQVEGVIETAPPLSPQATKGKGAAGQLPDPSAFEEEEGDEDTYAQFEAERQQEMLREQDEALDGVFRTVGNIRQQADDMGRELEEQGELLDSVDNMADRVGGKLQTGMKRVAWVLKNNEDTWSSCCIGVLIMVLILLLVLVLIL